MSGDTRHLKRLTDEQVAERLAAYNSGRVLEQDIELLRENTADLIVAEVQSRFGPERAERYAQVYGGKVDAAWIHGIAEYGRKIYLEKTSIPQYFAARNDAASGILDRIVERF